MPVLLVCHVGEGVGLGHLSRTLVLATSFRDRLGVDPHLLIQGAPMERADLACFPHQFVSSGTSLGPIIVDAASTMAPWLVTIDLHPRQIPVDLASVLDRIRAFGCRVVAIDGLLSFRDRLDLVFLPSLRCDDPLAKGPGAPIVYGMDCFLVPEEGRRQAWSPGSDVLVLTGGADTTGLGSVWPALLDAELPSQSHIQWIRGPYAEAPQLPSPLRLVWTEHHAPPGLQKLMASTNYALTVFGVSFFELIKMGVPTVVFSPYGEKDVPDLQFIKAARVAAVATDERDAIRQLVRLMMDDKTACTLSRRAEAALPGSGGLRLSRLVAAWHPDAKINPADLE